VTQAGGLQRSLDELAGAPPLLAAIGVVETLRVTLEMRRAAARGEPFAHIGPPSSERERLSREQIAGAVLLYRALTTRIGAPAAHELTGRVVVAAGARFLRRTLGPVRRAEIEALDDAGREQYAHTRGERFFNASIEWREVSASAVAFDVSACLFPTLCAAAGAPELATHFCAVDAAYFGNVEPGVVLDRPTTIAGGAERCVFRLRFAESDGERGGR
jgi:hypothetical protein